MFPKAKKFTLGKGCANETLLTSAGYIQQELAGVYNYLPLGTMVIHKIQGIIREELTEIGMQEITLSSLSSIESWKQTGRDGMEVLYRIDSRSGQHLVLNPTAEEIVAPLVKPHIKSYKDMPLAIFQIQDKFRDELRAKSGILRGKQFNMKDAYSFHMNESDMDTYYDSVTRCYHRIFHRLGIGKQTVLTYASGGDFSDYSHEFQALCPIGEDTVYRCDSCNIAINKEIIDQQPTCPQCNNTVLEEEAGIEVGNIFKLGTKFTKPFNVTYRDKQDQERFVQMACYGIGPTRVMGTIVELYHDEKGIIWPATVAPFSIHLMATSKQDNVVASAANLYEEFRKRGIPVLYDDRENVSTGEKFVIADLLGLPKRVVVSPKLMVQTLVEEKDRADQTVQTISPEQLFNQFKP